MGVSIRAYGRHRGVSEAAVRKAIRAGRITPERDGTIVVVTSSGSSFIARHGLQSRVQRFRAGVSILLERHCREAPR